MHSFQKTVSLESDHHNDPEIMIPRTRTMTALLTLFTRLPTPETPVFAKYQLLLLQRKMMILLFHMFPKSNRKQIDNTKIKQNFHDCLQS